MVNVNIEAETVSWSAEYTVSRSSILSATCSTFFAEAQK
jgi:hypothetical protein